LSGWVSSGRVGKMKIKYLCQLSGPRDFNFNEPESSNVSKVAASHWMQFLAGIGGLGESAFLWRQHQGQKNEVFTLGHKEKRTGSQPACEKLNNNCSKWKTMPLSGFFKVAACYIADSCSLLQSWFYLLDNIFVTEF